MNKGIPIYKLSRNTEFTFQQDAMRPKKKICGLPLRKN